MPARPMLSVFNAGELSPLLNGRIDLGIYYKGCSQLENFLPIKQGGVTRRPGTIFVNSTYSAGTDAEAVDNIVRLIPFIISETMGYVWEFTDQEIAGGLQSRVYYDHALVASLVAPSLFTLDSQYLQINEVMRYVHEDHPVYKQTYVDATTWSMSPTVFTASTGQEDFSTSLHFPRAIAFHDDRLILGGTATNPNRIWGSKVGDYDDFTLGPLSDDAFQFDIGSRSKHQIQWIESAEDLLVGTNLAEGVVYGSEEGITPATAFFRWVSTRGSAYFQPVFIDGAVIFIDRSQKQLFQLFNDGGGWKTNDLTMFADHIAGDGVGEDPNVPSFANYEGEDGGFCQAVMFQRDPYPFLWIPTKAGHLANCAFDKDAGMTAWSKHTTAAIGTTPTVDASYYGPAFFRSVAVIPNTLGQDELWAQVTRWHDDNLYKNYIEYFAPIKYEELEDGHFADCGVDYNPGVNRAHFTETDLRYYVSDNLALDPENGTTANWIQYRCTTLLSDLYYRGMQFTKVTAGSIGGSRLNQTISFTGNGTKTIQIILKEDTDLITRFWLRDKTSGSNRTEVRITWVSKKIDIISGTLYRYRWIDDNTVWVVMTAPGVIAANDNFIYLGGDTVLVSSYFTGVQVEDSATPGEEGINWLRIKPQLSGIVEDDYIIFDDIDSDLYPEMAAALNGKIFGVTDDDPWYIIKGKFIEVPGPYKDEISGLGTFREVALEVANLNHLENSSVAVNSDGWAHSYKTVTNGEIELDTYSYRVHVGLPYYPKLKTMNLEVPTQSGTSQTLKGKITQLFMRFYKTVSARIGKSEDDTLETVKMREWSDPWGNIGQEPFTGDRQVDFPQGYDRDKYIYITCETPTAITILGIIPDLFIYQG